MQSQAIPSLDHDLSRIVTEDGEQLVTGGSHWPLTGPLPQEMRETMERTGLCMVCHQNMTDAEVWDAVNSPKFVTNEEHQAVTDEAVRVLAEDRKADQSSPRRASCPADRAGAISFRSETLRVQPLLAAIALIGLTRPALAGSRSVLGIGAGPTAAELLSPCQEAENDARWGQAAEI